MKPPFWLHCNVCSAQYSNSTKFFVLQCGGGGHVCCKDCMKKSDRGKKCPVCQQGVSKYYEFSKLPDQMKQFFEASNELLTIPIGIFKFQRAQMKMQFQKGCKLREKCKKAAQLVAQKEQKLKALEAEYNKIRERRIKMQEKLKQIYNQRQRQPIDAYRTPGNVTMSTTSPRTSDFSSVQNSSISVSVASNVFNRSAPSKARPSFFNDDAPMLHSNPQHRPQGARKSFFD